MSNVKMFDFKRFADISIPGGDEILVNPTDIVAVVRYHSDYGKKWYTRVYLSGSQALDTELGIQEVEDEINRALECTLQAQKDLAGATTAKLNELIAEVKKHTESDPELFFKNNDLYPKGEN